MALVAYDNSDSSDYDEDTKEVTPVAFLNQKTEKKSSLKLPEPIQIQETTKLDEDTQSNKEPNLFNLLPQPLSKNSTFIEEDDEFLHKREVTNGVKPKAKITVPSLNDFKDVETSNSIPKPRVSNGKKSGLLSMLPQPKNGVTTTTRSLIPNVLTKKPSTSSVAKNNPTPVKKPHINPTSTLINDYSDDSDNEEVQNDFFSINKPVELSADVDVPLDIEQNTSTEVINASKPERRGIESFFKKEESSHVEVEPDYDNYSIDQSEPGSSIDGYGSENPSSNEVTLDEEAIMKLCGSRGKRKREDIQIVDINQQDVLADAREMLLKGLMDDTTKRVSASKKKGNEPTSQQRRKHQITYLAYQAKANEAELQNQWSNNKMSKRQTQAKYGF